MAAWPEGSWEVEEPTTVLSVAPTSHPPIPFFPALLWDVFKAVSFMLVTGHTELSETSPLPASPGTSALPLA